MTTYNDTIEYKPIIDEDSISPSMWIDRSYAIVQNALHKYYCTGKATDFANSRVYDAHFNLISYMFHQKELNSDDVLEMTTKLISRLYTNIIDKGYKVNPIAYRRYINQAFKYILIDHIRAKRGKPLMMLYADPQLAIIDNYKAAITVKEFQNQSFFTPEDAAQVKSIDSRLLSLISSALQLIMCKGGSGQLLYFVYHYYVNRNEYLFKTMPSYYVDKILLVTKMVEVVLPYKTYTSYKDKKDELYA